MSRCHGVRCAGASSLAAALVALFFRGGLRRSLLPSKRKEELKLGQRLFRHGGELDSLWFTGHPLVVVLAAAYVVHMDLVLVNVDAPDYSLPVSPREQTLHTEISQ